MSTRLPPLLITAFVVAVVGLSAAAIADNNTAAIGGNAFGAAQGNIQVNLAAGIGNAQANLTSVAMGGSARAGAAVKQAVGSVSAASGSYAATINGHAFNAASGLISINEASGAGNAQANSIAIAIAGLGGEAVTSTALSQVSGQAPRPMSGSATHNHVAISDDAFAHANGLIQINQAAGSSNASANHFALELNLAAKP